MEAYLKKGYGSLGGWADTAARAKKALSLLHRWASVFWIRIYYYADPDPGRNWKYIKKKNLADSCLHFFSCTSTFYNGSVGIQIQNTGKQAGLSRNARLHPDPKHCCFCSALEKNNLYVTLSQTLNFAPAVSVNAPPPPPLFWTCEWWEHLRVVHKLLQRYG